VGGASLFPGSVGGGILFSGNCRRRDFPPRIVGGGSLFFRELEADECSQANLLSENCRRGNLFFRELQAEECSQADLDTLLNLEARDWEAQQEENSFWLTTLVAAYSARYYRLVLPVLPPIWSHPFLHGFLPENAPNAFPCPIQSFHVSNFTAVLLRKHHSIWTM
jgi:hypothetical protein